MMDEFEQIATEIARAIGVENGMVVMSEDTFIKKLAMAARAGNSIKRPRRIVAENGSK